MHDVHWKEGMLLLPQHLQQLRGLLLERAQVGLLGAGVKRYGVRRIAMSVTADSVSVDQLEAVMMDGTHLCAPDGCVIPSHSIQDALAKSRGRLDVWVGVPRQQDGVSVEATLEHRMGRYTVTTLDLRDEVDAGQDSVREIEVRRLNARLFVDGEDRDGYECLRIARIGRASDLDPEPILDPNFIPPILDVTSGDVNLASRLSEVAIALREKNRSLGAEVASRPFSFALQTGADPESIFKLSATNAHVMRLEQLCQTGGVHPFDVYLELCQLAGSLAIFSPERRAPELPAYDHENLGVCFDAAIGAVLGMLDASVRRFYELAEFNQAEGAAHPLAQLEPAWVEAGSELYLGARTDEVTPEELDRVLGSQIKLFGQGDEAIQLAVGGVKLQREVRVPAALPEAEGVYYYRVDRESTPTPRWNAVQSARAVELVTAGRPLEGVRFSMYAVPRRDR